MPSPGEMTDDVVMTRTASRTGDNAKAYMDDLMGAYTALKSRDLGDIPATEDAIRDALGGIADVVSEWDVQGGHHYARLAGCNGREVVVSQSGGHYTARLYEGIGR